MRVVEQEATQEAPAAAAPKPNLRQRILAITAEVNEVKATSKDERGKRAIGIADVEDVVADAAVRHGVVFRWSNLTVEPIDEPKRDGSTYRLWMERLRITAENADDPDDHFEDEWVDVGTNPMASTSFARKGYYKSLFHITEEGDEHPVQGQTGPAGAASAAPGKPKWTTTSLGRGCPECGDGDIQLRVSPDGKQRFVGCSNWPDSKGSCKYREAAPPTSAEYDFLRNLNLLNAGEQKAVAVDKRFARAHGEDGWTESRDEWIARLTPSQRTELRMVLESKTAEVAIP